MAVLPGLLFFATLLLLPAWIYARTRQGESCWYLFFAVPSVTAWTLLAAGGFGPQSRNNLVEVIYLALAAVGGYYLKTFVIDRWQPTPRLNGRVALGLTVAAALLVRLLTPDLGP